MELYKELLIRILANSEIRVTFPDITLCTADLVERQSYLALREIKAILEDDSLTDAECFSKIEAIVSVFESLGSDAGSRHDFG